MEALAAMESDRVIAVIRASHVAQPGALVARLLDAGIRCVEFTFTTAGVPELLATARVPGAVVGAGTVTSLRQAELALNAGAQFIVSPAVVPQLGPVCRSAGVPLILGAMTPTEVLAAEQAGASAVKLFPASLGGPRYLEELQTVFPGSRFVPSGGIDETTARDYLRAGALAVSAGSALAPVSDVESGRHAMIAERARALTAALSEERCGTDVAGSAGAFPTE